MQEQRTSVEAYEWRRSQNRAGWAEAVAYVLCKDGRQELQAILTGHNQNAIAAELISYTGSFDRATYLRFKTALAKIFAGLLAKNLERAPFYGWSTQAFVEEVNICFVGTPIKPVSIGQCFNLNTAQGTLNTLDARMTGLITDVLVQTRDLSYFFTDHQRLQLLTPVVTLLGSWKNFFTPQLLVEGTQIQRYVNQARALDVQRK